MQIAAWRQYWTTNTFYVSRCPNTMTSANSFTTSDKDLQHIEHFVVFQQLHPGGIGVDIEFGEALWITAAEWEYKIGGLVDFPLLARLGLRSRLVKSIRESLGLRGQGHDERVDLDPKLGRGLNSSDLMVLVNEVSCTLYGREAFQGQSPYAPSPRRERNLVHRA